MKVTGKDNQLKHEANRNINSKAVHKQKLQEENNS